MRGALLMTSLLVAAALLAGCSGASDTTTTKSGTTRTTTHTTTITTSNTTTLPPNVPPTVTLTAKDAGGNVTNVVLVGGSLTFDATGSTDGGDGDGLSAIAIVVKDSNKTYAPAILYGNGAFTPATFTFDRPGPVNVTVSALDVRGDVTPYAMSAYVNQVQTGGPEYTFVIPVAAAADPGDCQEPTGGAAAAGGNFAYHAVNFNVAQGAQFVTAKITAGSGKIAICSPDKTAISPTGTDVTTNDGVVLTAPTGAAGYFVSSYASAPNASLTIVITVHYEPRAAAPAA